MDKVALVTGGTNGVGLQVIRDLIGLGYKVVTISRDGGKIAKVRDEFDEKDCVFFQGDVAKAEDLEKVYDYVQSRFNYLNVIINSAGIISPGGVEELSLQDWQHTFDVNLTAPFHVTKVMLPLLKQGEDASIVNVSSISSRMTGSSIAYSASKAGLDMMTQSLAKELSKYGIRVNTVNPGLLNTGFQITNHVKLEEEYEGFLEEASLTYPLGIGTAVEVSNLIMFLVSDKAKWITGSNYIIDGGRSVNI